MELQLDRVTKQYGTKLAVDRMNLSMKAGVYGLLGANGAGKTTLMRLLCDILNPTSGEIPVRWTEHSRYGRRISKPFGISAAEFRILSRVYSGKIYALYGSAERSEPFVCKKSELKKLLRLGWDWRRNTGKSIKHFRWNEAKARELHRRC